MEIDDNVENNFLEEIGKLKVLAYYLFIIINKNIYKIISENWHSFTHSRHAWLYNDGQTIFTGHGVLSKG